MGFYYIVDYKPHGVEVDKVDPFGARQDGERTVDGERHHRQLQFVGQEEGTLLEWYHLAIIGARPLGEYHQRDAVAQYVASIDDTLLYTSGRPTVHKDEIGPMAGLTHERNLAERLLEHPLEVVAQHGVNKEDVHRPLMVCHKDVGALLVEFMTALHLEGQQQYAAYHLAPPRLDDISPKVGVRHNATRHNGGESAQYRGQQYYWQSNKQLVDTIEQTDDFFHIREFLLFLI